MFVALAVIVLISFVAWFYIKWSQVRSFWAKKNVPHEPPHPILGSLTFLQKENPAVWMRRMYNISKPYVGVWLFWRPALIINDPDIARNVLIKDSEVFRDRFLSSGKSDVNGGTNIFTVNDPLWSELRRGLTAVSTSSKIRNLEPLLVKKTKELCVRLIKEQEQKTLSIRDVYADYTTDIIGTLSFGIASDSIIAGDSAMRKVTKNFQKFTIWRGFCWSSIFFFPSLVDIFGFTFFPKEAIEFLRGIFSKVVEQRGGFEQKVTDTKDLLDCLIRLKQQSPLNKDLTEEVLLAQASIFIQGGFDTTASALSFLTYELAHSPEVQDRLYEELKKSKKDDEEFSSAILADLPYLNAVVKETLRKYPPMGWLDRIASRDYKIDDKLTISAGTPIYVNCNGLHYDPEYFTDPETFKPERFLPENEKNIKAHTYMPFGDGPRVCIGKRVAQANVRFATAAIFSTYKVRPVPNSKKPSEIQIEKKGLFLAPGERIVVEFLPRN